MWDPGQMWIPLGRITPLTFGCPLLPLLLAYHHYHLLSALPHPATNNMFFYPCWPDTINICCHCCMLPLLSYSGAEFLQLFFNFQVCAIFLQSQFNFVPQCLQCILVLRHCKGATYFCSLIPHVKFYLQGKSYIAP